MMIEILYRSRCWIAFVLIALLAACNVKSDMDIHGLETKTMASLDTACMYWEQGRYDSAMAALNEAIVTAKASEDLRLMEKVQTTISTLNGDLDHTENMISVFLRRRKILNIILLTLAAMVMFILFLLYRSAQKRATIAEMNLSIAELQKESETLAETNRDNLFQRTMMIYKIFLIGENKDVDKASFQKLKSCVCGRYADNAYQAIFEEYNKVYPDVVQRIKEHQPALTEAEFRICILSMMPFSVKEVADILKVSSAMIGKARTSIRKKLGMMETRGSIEEFVLSL